LARQPSVLLRGPPQSWDKIYPILICGPTVVSLTQFAFLVLITFVALVTITIIATVSIQALAFCSRSTYVHVLKLAVTIKEEIASQTQQVLAPGQEPPHFSLLIPQVHFGLV